MVQVLQLKKPHDVSRINIREPWEVNWWCNELHCSKLQLETTVRIVGTSVEAVKRHLGM